MTPATRIRWDNCDFARGTFVCVDCGRTFPLPVRRWLHSDCTPKTYCDSCKADRRLASLAQYFHGEPQGISDGWFIPHDYRRSYQSASDKRALAQLFAFRDATKRLRDEEERTIELALEHGVTSLVGKGTEDWTPEDELWQAIETHGMDRTEGGKKWAAEFIAANPDVVSMLGGNLDVSSLGVTRMVPVSPSFGHAVSFALNLFLRPPR